MRVGGYETEEVLGTGSYGTVFRARDSRLKDRIVALKVVRPSSAIQSERTVREAETLAKFAHPNIVMVHDAGMAADGSLFIVMELVRGPTLATLMENGTPLDALLDRLAEAASGVAFAHERGVIHRDLKPSNVLVAPGGAKVCDFGIAKQLDRETILTRTGDLVGTLAYMSPEQAAGEKVGPATDVHALGAMLYEILAGRPPRVAASPTELMIQLATGEIERPSKAAGRAVPPALERLCLEALARDPARRPRDARAFLDALEQARRRPVANGRRRAALAGTLLVLAAGAVMAGGLLLRRTEPPPPPAPGPPTVPVAPPPDSPAPSLPSMDGEPEWYKDICSRSSSRPPAWFNALPTSARPKLPPDVRCLLDEGDFLNVPDGSVLVWQPGSGFVGKREVTFEQFERFATRTPVPLVAHPGNMTAGLTKDLVPNERATWRNPHGDSRVPPAESPVRQVTWPDATAYAEWAHARLPTKQRLDAALGAGKFGGSLKWDPREPGSLARLGRVEKRSLRLSDRRDEGQDLVAREWCADVDPTRPNVRTLAAIGAPRALKGFTCVLELVDESACSNATTFRIVRDDAR